MTKFKLEDVVRDIYKNRTICTVGWCKDIHKTAYKPPEYMSEIEYFSLEKLNKDEISISITFKPNEEQIRSFVEWNGNFLSDKRRFSIVIRRDGGFSSGFSVSDAILNQAFHDEKDGRYAELFRQIQNRVVFLKHGDVEVSILRPSVLEYSDVNNLGVAEEQWAECVSEDPEETALKLAEIGAIDDPDFWVFDVFDSQLMFLDEIL